MQHAKEDAQALSSETGDAVARLTRAVLSVRPLVDVLNHPVFVAPIAPGDRFHAENEVALEELLNRIASHCGAPEFAVLEASPDAGLTVFERIVSDRLRGSMPYHGAFQEAATQPSEIDKIIQNTIRHGFEYKFNCTEVPSFDGVTLKTYAAGDPGKPAVIIISACGMPAKLSELWMDFLAKEHFVLTWETRGLFGDFANVDSLAWDVEAQAKDLFAVMDHYEIRTGHIMGLCGGAVIAVVAAHNSPGRFSSLSLWYGDFELGSAAPKTVYQQNLQDVMRMAGAGRSEAAATHELFCDVMIKNVRADLANFIIYPYATSELLFRYGRLNGSIMSMNVEPLLETILQRTLVVTSQNDSTAHPEGSRHVAAQLPNAVLHVEPQGDHLSFYEAVSGLTRLAAMFIAGIKS
jgi:3-oxoadipate enol-lactonase